MELTENLLREINEGLRYDIDKLLSTYRKNGVYTSHDVRWKINLDIKGARLNFAVWSGVKTTDRQNAFNLIKTHIEKHYGLKLNNQRLYTYEVVMDFGNHENTLDPLELYTLLKINQIL